MISPMRKQSQWISLIILALSVQAKVLGQHSETKSVQSRPVLLPAPVPSSPLAPDNEPGPEYPGLHKIAIDESSDIPFSQSIRGVGILPADTPILNPIQGVNEDTQPKSQTSDGDQEDPKFVEGRVLHQNRGLLQQVIADVLPPTPDPSQFTFNETALASVESNSATLTLKLRLIGGTLLPFTSSNQDVVVKAFQQEVNSSSGNADAVVKNPVLLESTPGSDSNANLDTVVMNISISTEGSQLQPLADALAPQIQNAQLAGVIRQQGLYNLQRLSVDSYTVAQGSVSPAQSPNQAPAPAPIQQNISAPAPVPAPSTIPSVPPNPAPAPSIILPQTPAPAPSIVLTQIPIPAPAPSLILMQNPSPAPAPSVPPIQIPAPAPAPAPGSILLQAFSPAPIPAPEPSSLLVLPQNPNPAPAPELSPLQAPAPSPESLPTVAPAPAPVPEPSQGLAPSPTTQAPEPSLVPSEGPAPSPLLFGILGSSPENSIGNGPAPALSFSPEFSPNEQPIFGLSPSQAPSPDMASAPEEGSLSPEASPSQSPVPNVPELNTPSQAPISSSQAPSPGPSSEVSFAVRLNGVDNLNQTGRETLQNTLAGILGQDPSQISLGQSGTPSTGRRLLQGSVTVPVTVNSNNGAQIQQALQSLNNGQLQQQLANSGLNTSGTEILGLNGQPPISQPSQAPSTANSPVVPASGGKHWNEGAIIGGVVGGVVGALLLLFVIAICTGRCQAKLMRRRHPPKEASPSQPMGAGYAGFGTPRSGQTGKHEHPDDSHDSSPRVALRGNASGNLGNGLISSRDLAQYQGQYQLLSSNHDQSPLERTPSWCSAEGIISHNTSSYQDAQGQASSSDRGPISRQQSIMRFLRSNEPLAGKYHLDPDCIQGGSTVVINARDLNGKHCLCKFVHDDDPNIVDTESSISSLFESPSPVPELLEIIPAGLLRPELPICFVYSSGDWSLTQWLENESRPSDAKKTMAFLIASSLARIHDKGVTHGNLTPDNVFFSNKDGNIKLASFGLWAKVGDHIPLHPALQYAAPETMVASASGQQSMIADFTLDSWSLGVILLELFRGKSLADTLETSHTPKAHGMVQRLLGNEPLPWESDPSFFDGISDPGAREIIPQLLRRNPSQRLSINRLIQSRMFENIDRSISESQKLTTGDFEDQKAEVSSISKSTTEKVEVKKSKEVKSSEIKASPLRGQVDEEMIQEVPSSSIQASPSFLPRDDSSHEHEPVNVEFVPEGQKAEGKTSERRTKQMDMFKTEDLESNSEASSREPEILEGKQEVENVQVHRIPYTDLQNLKGSAISVRVQMERVTDETGPLTCAQILSGVKYGDVETLEVPMVMSKASSPDKPVFLMHQGGKFVLRIRIAAGSERGWVPLMISSPAQINISVARKNNNQVLEFQESYRDVSKWEGFAVWDTSSPQTTNSAGRHGQLTRLFLNIDCFCKGSNNIVTLGSDLMAAIVPRGYRMPANMMWQPTSDILLITRNLAWAQEAFKGATSFSKVTSISSIE